MRDFAEQLAEALEIPAFNFDPYRGVASVRTDDEVFSTERLAILLRQHQRTHQQRDIEASRQALTKGIDACARLLFAAHWHRDEFVERYGEEELPELLDALNWQMRQFTAGLEELNMTNCTDPAPAA